MRKHRVSAARRPELYEKWNDLDFERQTAIIFVETVPNGDTLTIDAVWDSGKEILVVIRHEWPPGTEPRTAGMDTYVMGVAFNKTEWPVRFLRSHGVSILENTSR